MGLLLGGLAIWWAVHLFPGLCAGQRCALIDKIGLGPYRGLFSLLLVFAIVCMVLGWRSVTPVTVYAAPPAMRGVTAVLMAVALILFVAGRAPTDIKRLLRHPQLTSVLVWSAAHLLSNGDSRSLVLFTGLALWAVVEMAVISRREAAWNRPEPVGAARTAVSAAIGLAAFAVVVLIHPWIAGVPALPF